MSKARDLLLICGDLCNLGDLALLLQNLEVAAAEKRRAFVRRWVPLPAEIESQVAEAGGVLIDGRNLPGFLALARRCDMVIGGGQLVRGNVSLRSLAFLAAGAVAAKAGGGSITTRGLGISAIGAPRYRFLWRQILKRADDLRVRDSQSAENASKLVPEAAIRLTADMAFLPSRLHDRMSGAEAGTESILVAPCIDGSEGRSIDGPAFPALLGAARARLPGAKLVFACHDPRPGMDGTAADRLIEAHGLSTAAKSDGNRLDALLGHYHRAGLVITNRLHSVIFSLLTGRPVLVIDDGSGKIAAVAERFGIPTLRLDGTAAVEVALDAALGYDRAERRRRLDEMAALARRNLAAG